jgi:16S rRNA (cytidine1402-2'-O)-methyltransferase
MSSRSASTSEADKASATGRVIGATGRVVVVATPIGNLGDLSPRAVAALASSDYVYCEDTRRTLKLFSHAAISGPHLVAHHRYNEAASTPTAVARAKAGATIAIVTDAGTPLVSDPGARLVRAALAEGIPVEAVPGPSAPLAALVVSGLATERWCFEGFLPRSGRKRTERLAAVAAEVERAVVVFESPYRVQRALDDLAAACGPERPVALCRELTKLHEEVWRCSLGEAATRCRGVKARGEYVIVVGPPVAEPPVAGAPIGGPSMGGPLPGGPLPGGPLPGWPLPGGPLPGGPGDYPKVVGREPM